MNRGPGNERIEGERKRSRERYNIETEWGKHKMRNIIHACFYDGMKNSSWWLYKWIQEYPLISDLK